MASGKLPEAALLGLAFLLQGCGSEPRVSPWGRMAAPPLGLYAEKPDLERRLAAIDGETAALGLRLALEVQARADDGTTYVVRSYEGTDRLGARTFACRVASPFGVVLAVGPPEEGAAGTPTELVRAADGGAGRVVASPLDLGEDGAPDLLLRARDGTLGVWTLGPRGANPIEISMPARPARVLDLGEDGIAMLGEARHPVELDAMGLALSEIATLEAGRFTYRSAAARRHHARERDRLSEAPEGEAPDAKARRLVARTFHAIRAGDDVEAMLRELETAKAPEPARRWLERLASQGKPGAKSGR